MVSQFLSAFGLVLLLCLSASAQVVQFNTTAPPDGLASDRFGYTAASSGSFLVLGSIYARYNATVTAVGALYLYDCTSFPCAYVSKINASDPAANDNLGYSVAISDTMIVGGAKLAKYNSTSGAGTGAAYVYTYNSTSVTQFFKLVSPTPASTENFGSGAAISGSLVAIGAGTSAPNVGSIYVFTCDGITCTLVTKLTNSTTKGLGRAVAMDGSILVGGAPYTTVGSASNQGAVYLFDCNTTSCTPGAILTHSGKASDNFGISVAIKGQLVVVGAITATGATSTTAGAAFVYRCTSAFSCTLLAKLTAPGGAGGDEFGDSVAISDFLVVVGARFPTVLGKSSAGAGYLWDCYQYSCRYVTKLTASNPASSELLGFSAAMLGWKVALGAYSGNLTTSVATGTFRAFDPTLAICNCSASNSQGSLCGSDRQCACNQGWTGTQCTTDVNECTQNLHNCSNLATCINIPGSFSCACNIGYQGNGTFCEDYDECFNVNNTCNQNAICSNTFGSYTCACASGFYGNGFTCTACGCGPGSIDGSCDSNATCTCLTGFLGAKCDSCEPGRFGLSCTLCPNCVHGECAEGITNNGSCACEDRYTLNADGVCNACIPDHFGFYCTPCPECNAGTCYRGITGNGTCICPVGWTNTNDTSFCSSCSSGYSMDDGGSCQPCHPTCKTCFGLGASQCLTCSGSLLFEPDLSECISTCPSGEYDNAGQCTSCHASCAECLGGGSGQCVSCDEGLIFDFGSCRSACQTSGTFNNNGTCKVCPLTCSACFSDEAGGCTACSTNLLVLDSGNCLARCTKTNTYVLNGACQDCDPSCTTCSGPSASECLSCTAPTSLSSGACVSTCPSKQFSNANQVCQACSDVCGSCSGPSFQDCTGCDSSSANPYRSGPTCVGSCPPFTYSPAGTFECQSCFCNLFSSNCDTSGSCLNCKNNTEGTLCDQCKSGYGRTVAFNSTESCTDLDECKLGTHDCHPTWGVCTNAIGTFTCACSDGFEGNGTFCQDINECALETADCPVNSTCTNTEGAYSCPCNKGLTLNGTECIPITSNTDNSSQTRVVLGAALGSVLGLAVVLSAFLLITYRLKRGPFASRKKNTLHDMIVEMDYGSNDALVTNPNNPPGPNHNMTTMLNTVNEIALPGFLMINTEKQLRMELDIAAGGGGKITIASILDPKLKEDNGGKEKVVVKLVTGVPSLDEEDNLLLFQQEVAAMSALRNHRFVATLIGFCNNPPTIVAPLYAGDLYGYIHGTESFKNLPAGHRITYPFQALLAYEIIDAFSVIHTVGIIHRDLKTKNLLLEATPDSRFPYKIRVSDFGICRIVQEQGIKNQNFLNIFGVSTRYAAPEVFSRSFLPNATLDPEDEKKTDVYSFAICLWEMFTKQIPWGDTTPEEIQKRVGNGERPELPEIKEEAGEKEIQGVLIDMISLCWNQNPHRRPTFKNLVDKIHSLKGLAV